MNIAKAKSWICPDLLSGAQTSGSVLGFISTQTNLRKDPLSGQEFGAQSNDEAHHGEATIPLFGER